MTEEWKVKLKDSNILDNLNEYTIEILTYMIGGRISLFDPMILGDNDINLEIIRRSICLIPDGDFK